MVGQLHSYCLCCFLYFILHTSLVTYDDLCRRSEEPISLNAWHELKVSRTAKSGILQVDSQRPKEGIAEVPLHECILCKKN